MEKIKKFLEGSVVIPYSDELLSVIDKACHSYISEEEEDKYADIEKMAEYFLWGIGAEDFQSVLNDSVNKENTINTLPKVVIQRLAAYECYIMIMEEEDENDEMTLESFIEAKLIAGIMNATYSTFQNTITSKDIYTNAWYYENYYKSIKIIKQFCKLQKIIFVILPIAFYFILWYNIYRKKKRSLSDKPILAGKGAKIPTACGTVFAG